MTCKVIHRVFLEHMSLKYLIDNVYYPSGNKNDKNLAFIYLIKNEERFQKNEGDDQLEILLCILLLTSSMYSQLITRFQAMASLLYNASDGFGDDDVFWYVYTSKIFANINR